MDENISRAAGAVARPGHGGGRLPGARRAARPHARAAHHALRPGGAGMSPPRRRRQEEGRTRRRRRLLRSRAQDVLPELRQICLSLPETNERLSHGSPTFFIRDKKTFVMFVDDHHGDGILGIWCAAAPGVQGQLVDEEPERFFVPPYVGHRGWLGRPLRPRPRLGRDRRDRHRRLPPGRAQDLVAAARRALTSDRDARPVDARPRIEIEGRGARFVRHRTGDGRNTDRPTGTARTACGAPAPRRAAPTGATSAPGARRAATFAMLLPARSTSGSVRVAYLIDRAPASWPRRSCRTPSCACTAGGRRVDNPRAYLRAAVDQRVPRRRPPPDPVATPRTGAGDRDGDHRRARRAVRRPGSRSTRSTGGDRPPASTEACRRPRSPTPSASRSGTVKSTLHRSIELLRKEIER